MATLQNSTVNGLSFCRGAGNIVSNTAFGVNSLVSISSGACNTGFGFNTLNNKTTGANNTAFGAQAGAASNNSKNTSVGRLAGFNVGGYAGGTHIGAQSGRYSDHCVVAAGFQAGYYSQNYSVSVGHRAGVSNGAYTVAIGFKSKENGSPANSVFFSPFSGQNATNGNSSVIGGFYTGRYSGGAANNVLVGWYSYQIFGYGGNDQSVLGRGNNTSCNCVFVGWTNVSDCRDKTNIQPLTNLGLNFVRKLNPVKYKWDRRQNYVDNCGFEYGVKDGTLKQSKVNYGFLAQEIEFAAKSVGENFDAINYDSFRDHYTLNYLNLVSSLVKALQEINDDLDLIETQLNS